MSRNMYVIAVVGTYVHVRDAYATIQSSVVNIAGARGVCRGADACVSYNVARMSANGPSVRPGTVQYVTVYI